ncbi:hypothetical protein DE146DRAFT_650315 [Phaeosphaeria sp. MPI-PUGE-AT-0046c]|nr:hypothetical protein DE146DRAFT_650315 [Phaeosphaeria sp. MPI-PUGE-AT-0046c]
MISRSSTLLLALAGSTILSTPAAAPIANSQVVDSTLLDIIARHPNALLPIYHYGEGQQEDYSRPFHWTRGV